MRVILRVAPLLVNALETEPIEEHIALCSIGWTERQPGALRELVKDFWRIHCCPFSNFNHESTLRSPSMECTKEEFSLSA